MKFTKTHKDGSFNINTGNNSIYWLQIKHISHQSHIEKVEGKRDVVIVLTDEKRTLSEIIVSARYSGIKVSGDTIKFYTNHFKNGFENNVGDLLNKLPGVGVDIDGNISYGGQQVGTLLLDGKDIFTGANNGLVIRNMSADKVDGAEIIQNYNSEESIEQRGYSKAIALNIKTKGRGKLSGYVDGNGGYKDKYRLKSFSLGNNNKFSLTSILASNNIGEPAFTMSDYVRRMLNNEDLLTNKKITLNLSDMETSLLYRPDNIYNDKSSVASFDGKYNVAKNFNISASALISHTNVNEQTSRTETFLSQGNTTINSESMNERKGNMLMTNMKTYWKPRKNISVTSNIKFDLNNIDTDSRVESSSSSHINHLQSSHQNRTNIAGNLSATLASDKHKLTVNVEALHSDREKTMNLTTDKWLLPIDYISIKDNKFAFNSAKHQKRTLLSAYFIDEILFSNSYGINTSIRYLYEKHSVNIFNYTNANEMLELQEWTADLMLKKLKGKMIFTIGSSFSIEDYNHTLRFKKQQFQAFPIADIEYVFNQKRKLSLNLSRRNEIIDIEKIISTIEVVSYNELKEESKVNTPYQTNNRLSLIYTDLNIEKEFYLYITAMLQTSNNAVITEINQEGIISRTQYVDNGHTMNSFASIYIDKRGKRIPINVKATLTGSYYRMPSILNKIDIRNNTYSVNTKLNVESKIKYPLNSAINLSHTYRKIK